MTPCGNANCKIAFTGGQGGKLMQCRCLDPRLYSVADILVREVPQPAYVEAKAFERLKKEFLYLQLRYRKASSGRSV